MLGVSFVSLVTLAAYTANLAVRPSSWKSTWLPMRNLLPWADLLVCLQSLLTVATITQPINNPKDLVRMNGAPNPCKCPDIPSKAGFLEYHHASWLMVTNQPVLSCRDPGVYGFKRGEGSSISPSAAHETDQALPQPAH